MSCESFQALMHAALDAELDPPQRARLEQHCRDCPACRATWTQHQAVAAGLQWLSEDSASWPESPRGCAGQRRAAGPSTRPARTIPLWPWARLSAAAALVALVVGLSGLWLQQPPGQEVVLYVPEAPPQDVEPVDDAPVGLQLLGASREQYIAVPQPSGHSDVHIVWLYPVSGRRPPESSRRPGPRPGLVRAGRPQVRGHTI